MGKKTLSSEKKFFKSSKNLSFYKGKIIGMKIKPQT